MCVINCVHFRLWAIHALLGVPSSSTPSRMKVSCHIIPRSPLLARDENYPKHKALENLQTVVEDDGRFINVLQLVDLKAMTGTLFPLIPTGGRGQIGQSPFPSFADMGQVVAYRTLARTPHARLVFSTQPHQPTSEATVAAVSRPSGGGRGAQKHHSHA